MPTYDYECRKCGHRFELFHSMSDETPKKCPKCKARARRVPSAGAGLLFKGSGFYITDHRSQSYRDKARQETGGAGAPKDQGGAASGSSGSGEGSSGAGGSGTSDSSGASSASDRSGGSKEAKRPERSRGSGAAGHRTGSKRTRDA